MLIVNTPGLNGSVIKKTIQVGGGIVFRIPGTILSVTCEVLTIDEENQSVEVKGMSFQGWLHVNEIKDVLNPGTYALDNAINVLGNK